MTTTSPWSPAEAKQWLEELKSSNLPVATFARQRGIAAHRLHWVLRKERLAHAKADQSISEPKFDEVVVTDRATRSAAPVELRLPSGLSIGVTRDFDEVAVRRLLELLMPC